MTILILLFNNSNQVWQVLKNKFHLKNKNLYICVKQDAKENLIKNLWQNMRKFVKKYFNKNEKYFNLINKD